MYWTGKIRDILQWHGILVARATFGTRLAVNFKLLTRYYWRNEDNSTLLPSVHQSIDKKLKQSDSRDPVIIVCVVIFIIWGTSEYTGNAPVVLYEVWPVLHNIQDTFIVRHVMRLFWECKYGCYHKSCTNVLFEM